MTGLTIIEAEIQDSLQFSHTACYFNAAGDGIHSGFYSFLLCLVVCLLLPSVSL